VPLFALYRAKRFSSALAALYLALDNLHIRRTNLVLASPAYKNLMEKSCFGFWELDHFYL